MGGDGDSGNCTGESRLKGGESKLWAHSLPWGLLRAVAAPKTYQAKDFLCNRSVPVNLWLQKKQSCSIRWLPFASKHSLSPIQSDMVSFCLEIIQWLAWSSLSKVLSPLDQPSVSQGHSRTEQNAPYQRLSQGKRAAFHFTLQMRLQYGHFVLHNEHPLTLNEDACL